MGTGNWRGFKKCIQCKGSTYCENYWDTKTAWWYVLHTDHWRPETAEDETKHVYTRLQTSSDMPSSSRSRWNCGKHKIIKSSKKQVSSLIRLLNISNNWRIIKNFVSWLPQLSSVSEVYRLTLQYDFKRWVQQQQAFVCLYIRFFPFQKIQRKINVWGGATYSLTISNKSQISCFILSHNVRKPASGWLNKCWACLLKKGKYIQWCLT